MKFTNHYFYYQFSFFRFIMNKESPVTIVNNLAQQFHLHFRVTVRLSSPGVYKSVLSIRNSSFFALSRNEKNAKRLSAVKALIYANKESLPLDYFRRLKILTNEIGKEIEIKVIQNVKNNVCVRINLLGFRCFYGRGSNYGEALENTAFNVMKYPNSWFNDLFQEENSLSLLLKEKEKPGILYSHSRIIQIQKLERVQKFLQIFLHDKNFFSFFPPSFLFCINAFFIYIFHLTFNFY